MTTVRRSAADGVSLQELFFILRRWRTLVVAVTCVGVALAVTAGMQQSTHFSATALMLVQPRENRVVDFRDGTGQATVDAAMLETHVKVLLSRDLALRVIDELKLLDDPEFKRATNTHGMVAQIATDALTAGIEMLPEAARAWLGLNGPPARLEAAEAPEDPTLSIEHSVALAEFERRLAVTQSGKSFVLAIGFWAGNALKAAKIANATADAYLEMLREDKRGASIAANRWLGERLESLREDYLRARTREQNFRVSNNIVTITDGEDINDRRLIQLQEQLIQVQAQRSAATAKRNKASALKARGVSLDGLTEIADSPVVQRLREEDIALGQRESDMRRNFGELHPKMIGLQAVRRELRAKIIAEGDRVLRNLQSTVDVIAAEEDALKGELAQVNELKSETGVQSVELAAIQQQTEASRRLYETFLQRYEETKQQADLITPDAKVVSRAAAPNAPNRVSLKFFAVVGFVASAFAGCLAAVFADRARTTARRGQDLEDRAEMLCLGLIAQLPQRQVRHGLLAHLEAQPRTVFAESMRSLATILQVCGGKLRKNVVAVTSALPREGKSTVATSLSFTLSRLGHKTLLVDLDLRRPNIGRIFGMRVDHMLDEVLDGSIPFDEMVVPDVVEGLDVLPVQMAHHDPVALLSSPQFKAMLADVSRRYDWVILDCPPTLGMSDARLVAQAGAIVLFVVRWDRTPLSAVQTSVKELKVFDADMVGLINGVNLRKFRAFGLGANDSEGYHHKYKSYYERA